MKSRAALLLACAVLLGAGLSGCEDPEGPALCLVRAGDELPERCEKTRDFSIADGDGFLILHELPEGITAPEPIEIRIETPCVSERLEVEQEGKRLVVPRIAPRGAKCFFSVSASVAQSELSHSVSGSSADCEKVAASCDAPDAGVGGAGGE